MMRRFLEAPSVYCTCNPSTMGSLFVCKFLIDTIIPLEAAAQKVLARNRDRNVAIDQDVQRSFEVSFSFSAEYAA